jgi:hypothetical protein
MTEPRFEYKINQETKRDPTGEKTKALTWLEEQLQLLGKPHQYVQDRKYMLHEMLNPPVSGGLSSEESPMEIAKQYFNDLLKTS